MCVICLNMHEGNYAIICRFKFAEICTKYAAISSTKYANKHVRNMQYMCIKRIICCNVQKQNMHIYAKLPYAQNMQNQICTNMQNQICMNMHFQNMHKYVFYMHKHALYAGICIRINMPLHANLNTMHKYAQNMHKICKNMQ